MSNSTHREVPPPLPPRRPAHVYMMLPNSKEPFTSDIAEQTASSQMNVAVRSPATRGASKYQRSSWNIKNVFSRGKGAQSDKTTPMIALPLSQAGDIMTSMLADDHSNTMATCRFTLSTPDLTNMTGTPGTSKSIERTGDIDEVDGCDLDVMDIERSNSLNTSTSQFGRGKPINVSANLQWSHNLSMTMSSSACDSSTVNLVGANVNSINSTGAFDISDYCRMKPIHSEEQKLEESSCQRVQSMIVSPNHFMLDNSSVYCRMAPVPTKKNTSKLSHNAIKRAELTKNITFKRNFDLIAEMPPLECSISADTQINEIGNEHCNSTLSSDEGIASSLSTTSKTMSTDGSSTHSTAKEFDQEFAVDASSPDLNEALVVSNSSEYQKSSDDPCHLNATKCDKKTPVYLPTATISSSESHTKYTVNEKHSKVLPKMRRKKSTAIDCPEQRKLIGNAQALPHTPARKVGHTTKSPCKSHLPRRNSSDNIENHRLCYANTNCYGIYVRRDSRTLTPLQKHSHNPDDSLAPHSAGVNGIKFDSHRHLSRHNHTYNLEKHSKLNKLASPRRIYNKCATFATRLRSPPSSPSLVVTDPETDSEYGFSRASDYSLHNRSFDSSMSAVSKAESEYQMSSGAFIRSFARFRRIDFSPLKTKINNILQRTNVEA